MHRRLLVLVAAVATIVPGIGRAVIPDFVPDLPVLGQQVPTGALVTSFAANTAVTPKVADGDVSDWSGDIARYAGTAIYSHGEYVYQDHIDDNWGADNGNDEQRAGILDPIDQVEPRTYRLEATSQLEGEQDPAGVGCPDQIPGALCGPANYGEVDDNTVRNETDIEEVRVAADASTVTVLVRTVDMTTPDRTGVVLVFADNNTGGANPAPGGLTTASKTSLLAFGSTATHLSNISAATVATNPGGFTNAIEIQVPRADVTRGPEFKLAVATCYVDNGDCKSVKKGDAKSDLLNVAFRTDEPQRVWMDRNQSFALHAGNIDRYMQAIDLDELTSGATESYTLNPGYYERIYVASDSPVNTERFDGSYEQSKFQHYGLYLPSNYRDGGGPYPTTWWTHYRGGHANDAAGWVPGLLRQFGEEKGNIMITPSARGTSTWYVGRGMVDFQDVWADAMRSFPIDPDRVYMSGYSMGGFASWLLPTLMPDRFAGSSPQEGPATQGLFIAPGVTSQPQNGGDPAAENTYEILENARNVPYVIYNGVNDELVWITGLEAMHQKLISLNDNNRLYRFEGGEHYAGAIVDRWNEAADYLNSFRRDVNPAHVTYKVWPAMEYQVNHVSTPAPLDFEFNSAYWVSGLRARTVPLTNGKPSPSTFGTIDATTEGHGVVTTQAIPEAGAGEQGLPYQMTGWRLLRTGRSAPANKFTATLTNLSDARLDLARMGISTSRAISAQITSDGATALVLTGKWSHAPVTSLPSSYDGSALTIQVPAGTTTLTIA
jgi:hypothetical protein